MANFIKPYNEDPFVGHLATPITSSSITKSILENLPVYRFGLNPLLRGLEIGLAHGYFLIGPFVKLGPLRNSDFSLLIGFFSTIGLICILTLGLTIYGIVTFENNNINNPLKLIKNAPFRGSVPEEDKKGRITLLPERGYLTRTITPADTNIIVRNLHPLQTRKGWDLFKRGFFVGACGSTWFAFICLSSIPTFTIT